MLGGGHCTGLPICIRKSLYSKLVETRKWNSKEGFICEWVKQAGEVEFLSQCMPFIPQVKASVNWKKCNIFRAWEMKVMWMYTYTTINCKGNQNKTQIRDHWQLPSPPYLPLIRLTSQKPIILTTWSKETNIFCVWLSLETLFLLFYPFIHKCTHCLVL